MRYIDPHNDKEFANQELLKHWMPVDLSVGGPEHAVGQDVYKRQAQERLLCYGALTSLRGLTVARFCLLYTSLINGLIPHFYEGEYSGNVSVYGMNVQSEELYLSLIHIYRLSGKASCI